MDSILVKKKKLEIHRVETALMDLDLKCDEMGEEITRLKKHMEISKETLATLHNDLLQLEGN